MRLALPSMVIEHMSSSTPNTACMKSLLC
jgi:hypothetical protein